jgi:hypothetical protein
MLPKIVAGLALALALVSGSAMAEPSPRPAPPVQAQAGNADEAFLAWVRQVMAELDRAGRATAPFLQMDLNFDENDPEAALAMVRELSRQAVLARAELAVARARLAALPAFAHPNAPADMLRIATLLRRDSSTSLENLDQLLGDMIELGGAVERGDAAEIDRLAPRIERAAVLMIQSQATMLRARQQLFPATTSVHHAIAGMAAMYDGMAALMPSDKDFDVAALDAAVAALDASLMAERAALALERATIRRSDPDYAIAMEIMETRTMFSDVNERARNELRGAAEAARAGASSVASRDQNIVALGQLEQEYQRIARRQIELQARLIR